MNGDDGNRLPVDFSETAFEISGQVIFRITWQRCSRAVIIDVLSPQPEDQYWYA